MSEVAPVGGHDGHERLGRVGHGHEERIVPTMTGTASPLRAASVRDAGPREQGALLVGGDGLAEEALDARRPEGHADLGRRRRLRVHDPDGGSAAGPAQDERRRPVGPEARHGVLLALLEAQARLAAQGVAEGRAPDADGVEDGRLDDDPPRGRPDLAGGTTHDAGDGQRAGLVGDEERLGRELALDVVERLEALALPGEPDDDAAVVDGIGIEGVDRLAQLDEHVVAGVDDVGDGPHARGDEAPLDVPGRRRRRSRRRRSGPRSACTARGPRP